MTTFTVAPQKWTQKWSFETFSQLFAHNPREAFEYRLRVLGDPIPAEWLTDEEKTEKKELNKKDLMELLKSASITFSPAATADKLLEKCVENNLV